MSRGGSHSAPTGFVPTRALRLRRRCRLGHGGGFSLLELLVVIVIISLLVSIVLPVIARARCQAKLVRRQAGQASMRIDPGLIAYYSFENEVGADPGELINKAIGPVLQKGYPPQQLDATMNNTALTGDGRCGKTTAAFNGSTTSIDCQRSKSLDLGANATFMAWINRTSGTNQQDVVTLHSVSENAGYAFFLHNNRTTLQWGTGSGSWPSSGTVTANTQIKRREWMHIAATRRGSTLRYYLNGAPDGQFTVTATPAKMSTQNMLIGANTFQANFAHFLGYIDEVAIYNRALDDDEIRTWYTIGNMD